ALFGNDKPVKIEYCSGNGYWVAERAKAEPDCNWIALEKKFTRVRKIWSKGKNYALENFLVVNGEALETSKRYFPSASVSEVYVNFPDPWPKKRHAKNRLIQPQFIDEIERLLIPGGTLTLVTDDEPYSEQMIEVMCNDTRFSSHFPAPYYTHDWPGYGSSYFEGLWREQGRLIRYHKFCKKGALQC
ncbi:MAG: tRNA (guanosine(46)-N7)-methyltransferase TrmB, partial [Chlamydiia bacterium]|nr:tRNA (guanosine(46)-N7)-methyltransferase TrmB [Chlamydiia bacterium]